MLHQIIISIKETVARTFFKGVMFPMFGDILRSKKGADHFVILSLSMSNDMDFPLIPL